MTVGLRCPISPVNTLPAGPMADPARGEFMCMAASIATVFTIAWVSAGSAARFFIDDGLVFVSANWVFSSGSSLEEAPCARKTFGMRDLETGATAAALSAVELVPGFGVAVPLLVAP